MDEADRSPPDPLVRLSPSERRVFDFVREGRQDAEIAVRLGIPTGEVKDHIQRAAAKLELGGRQGLRGWSPERPEAESLAGRQPALRRAGAAATAVLAVALIVGGAAWLLTRDGRADGDNAGASDASPTPEGAGAPTATNGLSEPILINGKPLPVFTWGEPVNFPADVVMWVESGCVECQPGDPSVRSLDRIWRAGQGSLQIETLFSLPVPQIGEALPASVGNEHASGWTFNTAAEDDGSDIAITFCTPAACQPAMNGEKAEPGSQWFVYRSRDGGLSWREEYSDNKPVVALAVSRDGVVVLHPVESSAPTLSLEPGAREIGATPDRAPWGESGGEILWRDGERLLRGSNQLPFRPTPARGYWLVGAVPMGSSWLVSYSALGVGTDSGPGGVLLTVDPEGSLAGGFAGARLEPVTLIAPNLLLANTELPRQLGQHRVPVVVNLETGVISPVAGPFAAAPYKGERNTVVAALAGDLYQVVVPGGCAPAWAQRDRPPIRCVPHGVILRAKCVGCGPSADGWLNVILPDGTGVSMKIESLSR